MKRGKICAYGTGRRRRKDTSARLRLAQMENPDLMDKPSAEPARTLLNDCLAKAAAGDFITLKGISEYVTPEQWEQLTATLRKKAQGGTPAARRTWHT